MDQLHHANTLIAITTRGPHIPASALGLHGPGSLDKLKRSINTIPLWDLPITPRWRLILNEDWTTILDTPAPLTLDKATRQHSIKSGLTRHPRDPTEGNAVPISKLILHFPALRQRKAGKQRQT